MFKSALMRTQLQFSIQSYRHSLFIILSENGTFSCHNPVKSHIIRRWASPSDRLDAAINRNAEISALTTSKSDSKAQPAFLSAWPFITWPPRSNSRCGGAFPKRPPERGRLSRAQGAAIDLFLLLLTSPEWGLWLLALCHSPWGLTPTISPAVKLWRGSGCGAVRLKRLAVFQTRPPAFDLSAVTQSRFDPMLARTPFPQAPLPSSTLKSAPNRFEPAWPVLSVWDQIAAFVEFRTWQKRSLRRKNPSSFSFCLETSQRVIKGGNLSKTGVPFIHWVLKYSS